MRLAKQAILPEAPVEGSRTGIERHRPSRLTKPLTQDEVLTEVVPAMARRLVASLRPTRLILFGSVARGQMGPRSDLDVLVVVADGVDQNRISKDAYRSLRGLGMAVDVLVVSEGDLALHGEDPWMVYRNALLEGRELYRAEAQA